MKALTSLEAAFDTATPGQRRIGIFRELTKMHEEALIGSAAEIKAILERDPQKQRGEFVVIVEGC